MIALGLASALAGAAWGLADETSFAQTPPIESKQGTESTGAPPSHDKPEESFWQRTTSEPISLFTLSIAVLSAVLAVSTVGLWIVTYRTARRQLRAYVAMERSNVTVKGGTITLELKFINAGQTPACEFYALAQTGVFKKDVTPPPIEPPDETLADKSVVGPGRTRCYVKIIEASRNDIKLIKDGKKYGFLWGEARYQDIFGKRRYLTFIYRTGFDVRGNWILQPTKGGEKTN